MTITDYGPGLKAYPRSGLTLSGASSPALKDGAWCRRMGQLKESSEKKFRLF